MGSLVARPIGYTRIPAEWQLALVDAALTPDAPWSELAICAHLRTLWDQVRVWREQTAAGVPRHRRAGLVELPGSRELAVMWRLRTRGGAPDHRRALALTDDTERWWDPQWGPRPDRVSRPVSERSVNTEGTPDEQEVNSGGTVEDGETTTIGQKVNSGGTADEQEVNSKCPTREYKGKGSEDQRIRESNARERALSRRRDQDPPTADPPTDDELVAWEDAVSAWAELQPFGARQLVFDAGAGRQLLLAMRDQGHDRLVQRLRHAARGTSWHARAVRGEAKGYTRTTAVTELLAGRMAEALDAAAAAHPDDRPTRADWRTSERFPTPVDASNTAETDDAPPAPPPPTPPELRPVWERALEQLREVVDPEEVTVWLGDASLVELEDGRARIAVRSAYYAEWCAHEYAVLAEILGVADIEYFAVDHVVTTARTATV